MLFDASEMSLGGQDPNLCRKSTKPLNLKLRRPPAKPLRFQLQLYIKVSQTSHHKVGFLLEPSPSPKNLNLNLETLNPKP